MKKFYSLLIALLAVCGLAQAQTTVTFTPGADTSGAEGTGAQSITKDGVTIAISGGTLSRDDNYRIYKSQTLTVSSEAGAIVSVQFTCTVEGEKQYGPGCFITEEGYTFDGKIGTWTGNATEVVFTASTNQVRATEIVVTLGSSDPNFVAKPTITPASGTYHSAQEVSIKANEGTTIYYTTDGSEPTTSSKAYTAPFTVSETTTVKAIAVKGENKSEVVESVITIETITAKTIAEVIADGAAEQATTAGTVYAAYDMGFMMGDGTGYIFVYGSNTVKVGDQVTVTGKVSIYGGCYQLSGATVDVTGNTAVTYPTAREIDGAALDALVAEPVVTFVKVKGTLTSVGNYKNFTVEGATATGSILVSAAVLGSAAVGNEIEVTGFFVYQSGSGKYGNIVATEVKVLGGDVVETKEYTSLVDVKKDIQAGKTDMMKFKFSGLTVVAASGKNVYVTDGKNGICFFATNAKELKGGDKISGSVEGQLATYSGLEEISVTDNYANVTVDSEGNAVVAQVIGLDEISTADASAFQCLLVTVKGVKFQAEQMASKSVTIKDADEIEFTVYDSFNTISSMTFDTNATYDLTGVLTYHNGYQLAPRTTDDVVKLGGDDPGPDQQWNSSLEEPITVARALELISTLSAGAKSPVEVYVKGKIAEVTEISTLYGNATYSISDDGTAANALVVFRGKGFEGATFTSEDALKVGDEVVVYGLLQNYVKDDVSTPEVAAGSQLCTVNGVSAGMASIGIASKTGAIYTLAGQRVNKAVRGLYIVGGKKVFVQ